MKEQFLENLRCLSCGGSDLALRADKRNGSEILDGVVHCQTCASSCPIRQGILRAADGDRYARSFSFEWKLHRKTQLDSETSNRSAITFAEKTGLNPIDLSGKSVLDVGVGTGRFADVVSRAGANVTGVDLSLAVETAVENIGDRQNVNIVQADLFALPFAKESFDVIYSIGVLHHTPDCRRAFLSLVPYLRPGGTIAIWVYDAHVWAPGSIKETANRAWRGITTRLPNRVLYALCIMGLPLYFWRRIPGADQLLHLVLPGIIYHALPSTNRHRRIAEHLLDTFDWYAPKYQSKHTYPEVFSWFKEAELEDIRVLSRPVSMSGRKPPDSIGALHDVRIGFALAPLPSKWNQLRDVHSMEK